LLLCLNLAFLETDRTGTVRFSFHHYKEMDWDLEHIRATAERLPATSRELMTMLQEVRKYLKRLGPALDEKLAELLARIPAYTPDEPSPSVRDEWLRLYAEILETMDGAGSWGDSNRLWNLTLLDASTNRGYGNSPFAVKRAWILRLEEEAKYVLPSTRHVFTKSYTTAPVNLLSWTPQDAKDYRQAMIDSLKDFFAETWSQQP
jgi:hypothetical protein